MFWVQDVSPQLPVPATVPAACALLLQTLTLQNRIPKQTCFCKVPASVMVFYHGNTVTLPG